MNLQSKETHAFVKLLTRHQSALRGFIISMMPGSPDVEDVLQDTNVVIWEKMDSFEVGTNFRAWVFAIAKNAVLAHLRKAKRDRSPGVNEKLTNLIAETWYQREAGDLSKKEIALQHCLGKLDQSERAIIEARYSKDDNLNTLAATTARPASTLRVALFRIRERLRRCISSRIAIEGRLS